MLSLLFAAFAVVIGVVVFIVVVDAVAGCYQQQQRQQSLSVVLTQAVIVMSQQGAPSSATRFCDEFAEKGVPARVRRAARRLPKKCTRSGLIIGKK